MVEEGAGVCWSGVLLGCVNDSLDVAVGEGEAGGLSSAGGGLGEGAGFEFGDEDAEGGGALLIGFRYFMRSFSSAIDFPTNKSR